MNNPIHPVLARRVPNFVRQLYPKLLKLVEDLESYKGQNAYAYLSGLLEEMDVPNSDSLLVDTFLKELGWDLERETILSKKLLLHFLREIYLAKGSPESVSKVLRLFFGVEAAVDYPHDLLFIPSECDNTKQIVCCVKVDREFLNRKVKPGTYIFEFRNKKLRFGATVYRTVLDNGGKYVFFLLSGIVSGFVINDKVRLIASDEADNFEGTIAPLVGYVVEEPGSGYRGGDKIYDPDGLYVASVQNISMGRLDDYEILDGGNWYRKGDTIHLPHPTFSGMKGVIAEVSDGNNAIVALNIRYPSIKVKENVVVHNPEVLTYDEKGIAHGRGAVIEVRGEGIGQIKTVETSFILLGDVNPEGQTLRVESVLGSGAVVKTVHIPYQYVNLQKSWRQGIIGETSRLHDSLRWQQYSYDVESELSYNQVYEAGLETFHPAGIFLYNKQVIEDEVDINITVDAKRLIKISIQNELNVPFPENQKLLLLNFMKWRNYPHVLNAFMLDRYKGEELFDNPVEKFYNMTIEEASKYRDIEWEKYQGTLDKDSKYKYPTMLSTSGVDVEIKPRE